ncbi:hypothetical protein WISP_76331 [Willisornis vidua]|uniref:Uncharacterized protein n=1 Tax=Willisornis vidua TaxID=1566151 RepID=A0ABQ9DAJ5_9PASS|nr:hypothetical protein WISP_76331 [Willisornis vidua]
MLRNGGFHSPHQTLSHSTQTVAGEQLTGRARSFRECTHKPSPTQGEKEEAKNPDIIVMQDVAKAEQSKTMEVAPIQKRKYKTKSVHPVDDEVVVAPSQPADSEPKVLTKSLSFDNLRGSRKDIARQPGEPILTWLIRVWDLMGETFNRMVLKPGLTIVEP